MTLSRRLFVQGSAAIAATAAGASALPGLAPALTSSTSLAPSTEGASGLVTGVVKPLPFAELPGFLGKEQLRWHHESHYGGALKAFVGFDASPTGNHRPRVQRMNSVLLHETYFDNMTATPGNAGAATNAALVARFGSFDTWREDFATAAKAAAGWAVLAFHPTNKKLYHVVTDSHDDGPAWLGVPLLVIDMYEHSYYLDFQNKKADYVEGFLGHVDWQEVERRLRACQG